MQDKSRYRCERGRGEREGGGEREGERERERERERESSENVRRRRKDEEGEVVCCGLIIYIEIFFATTMVKLYKDYFAFCLVNLVLIHISIYFTFIKIYLKK